MTVVDASEAWLKWALNGQPAHLAVGPLTAIAQRVNLSLSLSLMRTPFPCDVFEMARNDLIATAVGCVRRRTKGAARFPRGSMAADRANAYSDIDLRIVTESGSDALLESTTSQELHAAQDFIRHAAWCSFRSGCRPRVAWLD